MQSMAKKLRSLTASTAFSGIGGFENALSAVARCVGTKTRTTANFTMLSALDFFGESRKELELFSCGCLFGDIKFFINPTLWQRLSSGGHSDSTRLLKHDFSDPGAVVEEAHCFVHNRLCRYKAAFVHCAGSPCTDWSPQGTRKGEDGETRVAFLAWVAMRICWQEPVIIQENVVQFPSELLEQLIGHLYNIQVGCDIFLVFEIA